MIVMVNVFSTADSALDAAAQGATQGVLLIGNIAANVIAFLAFISFLNAIFTWVGSIVGFDDLTFEVNMIILKRNYYHFLEKLESLLARYIVTVVTRSAIYSTCIYCWS